MLRSLKNVATLVATLTSKITRFYRRCCDVATSKGDHPQVHPRLPSVVLLTKEGPQFLVTGFSDLKPKIDPNLLPIPGLTFCNPSKLEILSLG
jgi:hypothetical protein